MNAARPPGVACASRISSGSRLQRMQPCRSGATFAVFLIMQMAGPAFAAHPLVTDDTSTQGKSKHQIEFNTDHATEGRNRSRVSALTYSYGSAGYIDLYGSIPFVLASQSGAGDISFGAKWRFMEVGRTSLALKPEIFFATGNARRGLGNGRTSGSLTLLASHRHGSWAVHANLGLSALRYRFSSVRASN